MYKINFIDLSHIKIIERRIESITNFMILFNTKYILFFFSRQKMLTLKHYSLRK